jgi:hypothetical protein
VVRAESGLTMLANSEGAENCRTRPDKAGDCPGLASRRIDPSLQQQKQQGLCPLW